MNCLSKIYLNEAAPNQKVVRNALATGARGETFMKK